MLQLLLQTREMAEVIRMIALKGLSFMFFQRKCENTCVQPIYWYLPLRTKLDDGRVEV